MPYTMVMSMLPEYASTTTFTTEGAVFSSSLGIELPLRISTFLTVTSQTGISVREVSAPGNFGRTKLEKFTSAMLT